jgi:hypothetical protein
VSQYKLNAAGKVIQIGTDKAGSRTMYFLNLRIMEEVFIVEVICIFKRDTMPPMKGRIP